MAKLRPFVPAKGWTFDQQLEWLISGPIPERSWFTLPQFSVYLRRTIHLVGGRRLNTIDLASIEVDSRFRGQGVCSGVLSKLEQLAKTTSGVDGVYVESVLSPVLRAMLVRRGYQETGPPLGVESPNFYRAVTK